MISPLEQVKDLIIEALRSQKALRHSFVAFFIEAIIGVLTICGRVNFSQLARYGKSCEQRFRQNFRKAFDWLSFNRSLVDKQPGHRYAIAIDPSFITKSGTHTGHWLLLVRLYTNGETWLGDTRYCTRRY